MQQYRPRETDNKNQNDNNRDLMLIIEQLIKEIEALKKAGG